MNASLALCAAVLSALPAAQPTETRTVSLYPPALSQRFDAVIRGQTPADLTTPMMTVPTGPQSTTVLQPVTPDGGVPSMSPGIYGSPSPGPTYSAPMGVAPYAAPAVGGDPFLTDPNFYIPGGPNQSGRWGWYAGYDNVFLIPHYKHNAGSITANAAVSVADTQNVEWDFTYSPRVWIGLVEPDGTGALARWFLFDHTQSSNGGFQSIDLNVIDFEKTWHRNTANGAITASGGFRYAALEQELTTSVRAGANTGRIATDTGFHGAGPTAALNGRHRLARTNWSLFAGARLSFLYGSSSSSVYGTGAAVAPPVFMYEHGDDLLAVTDLQIGLDWSAPICQTSRLFFRVAAESQHWFGSVNTSAGNTFAGASPLDDGNFGLFGFTVGTGIAY